MIIKLNQYYPPKFTVRELKMKGANHCGKVSLFYDVPTVLKVRLGTKKKLDQVSVKDDGLG